MRPEPDAPDWEWAVFGFGYSIGWCVRQLKRLNRWLASW